MKPEGSSLYSQKPEVEPHPEPYESSLHLHNTFSLRCILILPSHTYLNLPCDFLPLSSTNKYFCISHFPMFSTFSAHIIPNIRRRIQIMKLSPLFSRLLLLSPRSKYSPEYFSSQIPSIYVCYSLRMRDQDSGSYKTNKRTQSISYVILFLILRWDMERQRQTRLNDNKHIPHLICSSFDHEYNFDLALTIRVL
jgi:hypothetical protein